ncbi:MAG: hypothetical protein AAGH90_09600 [Pseudomonadota bacterium]
MLKFVYGLVFAFLTLTGFSASAETDLTKKDPGYWVGQNAATFDDELKSLFQSSYFSIATPSTRSFLTRNLLGPVEIFGEGIQALSVRYYAPEWYWALENCQFSQAEKVSVQLPDPADKVQDYVIFSTTGCTYSNNRYSGKEEFGDRGIVWMIPFYDIMSDKVIDRSLYYCGDTMQSETTRFYVKTFAKDGEDYVFERSVNFRYFDVDKALGSSLCLSIGTQELGEYFIGQLYRDAIPVTQTKQSSSSDDAFVPICQYIQQERCPPNGGPCGITYVQRCS